MQQFLQALRTQRVSELEIAVAILAILGLTALWIFRSRWLTIMARIAQKRSARRQFLEICRDRGLSGEEQDLLLKTLAAQGHDLHPDRIQSNLTFDRLAQHIIVAAYAPDIPRLNFLLTSIRSKLGFRPPARSLALSSTRELPPGQQLYIVFGNGDFLEGIISEVDETKLVVLLPAGASLPISTFSAGAPLRIYFNRSGDARYAGACYLLKLNSEDEALFAVLSHSEELKRDQRRQDFRVDEGCRVQVWVVPHIEDIVIDPQLLQATRSPEEATLEDLSGGGASLIFQRELPIHQQVYVNLDGQGPGKLPLARATVIRSQRRSGRGNWAISVRFDDLRPSERQKLIQHVFAREREAMKAF
ncbi:MAG TPA: PilZ domain-containing protein [bacterium]